MSIAHKSTESQTPPGWETVELRGGPSDRQFQNMHRLETFIDVSVGSATHRYFRTGRDAVAYHESLIKGAFNGGRKR